MFEGQLAVLLEGKASVVPGADPEADTEERAEIATPEPTGLARYDAVVGSDSRSPEILGRGFLAVVSIDRVTA